MSEMERVKAVRLRLPEEIAKLKFRNEKYDCEDDLQEYLDRPEFSEFIGWKKPGLFMARYGGDLIKDENGNYQSKHEYYIDIVLADDDTNYDEYTKSRMLTENELEKYIPKFKTFFDLVKLPCPPINKDTLRVVEFVYYNGCDAPCCFDITVDKFYQEV
jgi:hypothetical protein